MCKIVYEDNHLLVAVKPPNLLTQGDATGDDCLAEAMKRYLKETYHKPGEAYLGLIHRMDRPVGGLVCMAKTSKAAARLSEQLRAQKMHREYLAVTVGCPPESGELTDWLAKAEDGGMLIVPEGTQGAQRAVLRYDRLAAQDGTALLHICLQTGRKHQIRVQLAHAGWPILYDMRYGAGVAGKSIGLWGAVLRVEHPTLRTPMTFLSAPEGPAFAPYGVSIQRFLSEQGETR